MSQRKYFGTRENVRRRFSKNDYWIVKQAVRELPLLESLVVELRFWRCYSIQEIADVLQMSWDEVETCLNRSYNLLKDLCLNRADFSRSMELRLAA